jgi:hypothetical protein
MCGASSDTGEGNQTGPPAPAALPLTTHSGQRTTPPIQPRKATPRTRQALGQYHILCSTHAPRSTPCQASPQANTLPGPQQPAPHTRTEGQPHQPHRCHCQPLECQRLHRHATACHARLAPATPAADPAAPLRDAPIPIRPLGRARSAPIAHQFAHRLQLQERLTHQIADEVQRVTGCNDIFVVGRGEHLCMSMRGIKTPSIMSNSVVRGRFRELSALRAEAFDLMGRR